MTIPTNMHEMYAVLAVIRPEVALEGMDVHVAAALIRCKWEDALPQEKFLRRDGAAYRVADLFEPPELPVEWHPDPITALYHFHMGRQS